MPNSSPKSPEENNSLFANPKKRRTIIVILLIILIILILLLISRCSYELAHGTSGLTGQHIGIETIGGDPGSDTTAPHGGGTGDPDDTTIGGDDTSKPIGGGTEDPDDTTDPDDTSETEPPFDTEEPGDQPNDDVDTSITLRPFKPGEKVEFRSQKTLPGDTETVSVVIDSKFYQSRTLKFKLNVTKDKTHWEGAKLADMMIATIFFDNGIETFTKTARFSELDGIEFDLGKIHAHGSVKCDVSVKMDTNAGNEYINATLEADFIWRAE